MQGLSGGEFSAFIASLPIMLHQVMVDTWVPPAISHFIKRQLEPNPLVEIYDYDGADRAFARHGIPVSTRDRQTERLGYRSNFPTNTWRGKKTTFYMGVSLLNGLRLAGTSSTP